MFTGPVCVAGVIWLDKDPDETIVIKDSKILKKRTICNEYILNNCYLIQ